MSSDNAIDLIAKISEMSRSITAMHSALEKGFMNKKRLNSDSSGDLELLDKTKKSKFGDTPSLDETTEGSDDETTATYGAKMVWSEETQSDDDTPTHDESTEKSEGNKTSRLH